MRRIQKKLFRIADELVALDQEEQAVAAELEFHRHLADDAVRDAAVSGLHHDGLDAGLTVADVTRFERRLVEIRARRTALENARADLVDRL